MRSLRVVWTEPRVVQIEEWEVPQVGERQVLLKAHFSLISPGTERAFLLHLPNTPATFPQYPGYCAVGHVIEAGNQVQRLKVGDRVVWAGRHVAHAVVAEDALLPVPAEVSNEEAVFFNLIAIALQQVKLRGGFSVISVDLIDELTEGGAHVVIEATGSPEAVPLAFKLARRMGRVILLGSTRGEAKSVNFYTDVHRKGLVVIGVHGSGRPQVDSSHGFWTARDDQTLALKLLAARRLQVTPLIAHKFRGIEAPTAYELLSRGDMSAVGILLDRQDV